MCSNVLIIPKKVKSNPISLFLFVFLLSLIMMVYLIKDEKKEEKSMYKEFSFSVKNKYLLYLRS